MTPPPTEASTTTETRGVSGPGRTLLLLASIGGAISNFGILALSPAVLGVTANLEFLVFWSLLFGMFGVQSGMQNEATRATTDPEPHGARVIGAALIWGAVFAVVVGGTSWVWAPHLLPGSARIAVPVLTITALLYPLYITTMGTLGGARRWEWYGGSLLIEVVLRGALVLAAAVLGWGLAGFEMGSAAAVLTLAIILLVGRAPRRTIGRRADIPLRRLLRNGALAMTSTAFTALLVTGYSVLVKATNPLGSLGLPPREAAALLGACMLAVSLTRAPIMMPLTAFVGVVISAFTRHRGTVAQAVARPFAALGAIGLLGAAAAWPIGPWVLRLLNPEYDLPGWYFAALTASSVLLAWLTILGALALATQHHVLYVVGWAAASAVAIGCLMLPLHLTVSTALSVSLGPLTGCVVIFAQLSRPAAHRSADPGRS